ncbi:MAG: endonuclease III [Vicinamibacterales bacterium]|jgi:endonuclease-3|nr:endonuclease III [Acidobacteriota bacterium]MDP6372351.1 endonuclease III [Vicinamibacterales bacterium]MDP6608602.1 endonuclease III [Vicinamibacterales bacterium]HAK54380.1 endonuclease III [Acidobacteriota bacterium]|tara:strand:+ start:4646 stop:5317 length:672 start_codon:yes stop_codon:yes gene_type:complete
MRRGPAIPTVLRRLGRAIERLEIPAMEKIADGHAADPFRVLIGTMLSAQTKDAVTLVASTRLFDVAPTPTVLAGLTVRRIERLIYPVSFYRHKAKHVKTTSRLLLSRHAGAVPTTMAELLDLPGVGRKTANLVLILAHRSQSNICVDTHVHRISNRLGWVRTKTPDQTEQALYDVVPRRWWPDVNRFLVTWGQNVCKPVYPVCRRCAIEDACPRLGVTRVGKG